MSEKASRHKTLYKYLLLVALLVGYFGYLSYEYDIMTGGIAALLTWSFFVLCTPIADAGFLLDFPLRMLFGIRMLHSEMVVWTVAISLNAACLRFAASYYDTTALTRVFRHILTTPYPYWGVIALSLVGTFLSVLFGDHVVDSIKNREEGFFHSRKFYYLLGMVAVFLITIAIYYHLIQSLGIADKL